MPEVFVGIGSNVSPVMHVRRAVAELRREFGDVAISPAYRNPAVGFEGEDFLNLVARFETSLGATALVDVLHKIEKRCGRQRDEERWGPRTLDLDLLTYGKELRDVPPLPRADILKRAFVLRPLADIAPDGRHPGNGETYAALWSKFKGDSGALQRVELAEPDGSPVSKRSAGSGAANKDEIIDEKLS